MKEYSVVELNNGKKYAILDFLEYQSCKYFLLSLVLDNNLDIDNKFDIFLYNDMDNKFELIGDKKVYNYVKFLFEKRMEQYNYVYDILDNISNMNFVKLRIVEIDGYNYVLEKENGEKIVKNIEIYSNLKLRIGDYFYMVEKTVLEDNIFQFGPLINSKDEIIKIVSEKHEFYLQRYYG